jgi:2-hydroxycyclohexanecarboxyl-CoA dehydrogenase
MAITIEGRTAFITGGASGIGLGLAKSLLAAGAKVIIADLAEDAVQSAIASLGAPNRSLGLTLDVRDRARWAEARGEAEAQLGPVTLLINNAGVTGYDRIVDTPPEYFDWLVGVNLTGVFNGVHTFGRAMIDRALGGHIVNTASIAGLYGSDNMTVGVYAATKHAVVGLSDRLRVEMAEHGIGVSVLCPGLVATGIGANVAKLRPVAATVELKDNPVFGRLRSAPPAARLDPDTLGPFIIRGIEEDRAYIIPHPHFAELVEARHQRIMGDFGPAAAPELPIPDSWRDLA